MKIIGINGFKRAGKGEAALAIDRVIAPEFTTQHVGFADKLKVLAARTLGWKLLDNEGCITMMDVAKEQWLIDITDHSDYPAALGTVTGREYLQNLGNEARNVFGNSFWIDQVLSDPARYDEEDKSDRYDELLDPMYPNVALLIITDVRYPNEAERIRALGGVVWRVLRDGVKSDGHASEISLPDELVDWELHNNGTLGDLEVEVRNAIHETLGVTR